ncbi:MAG: YdeI/OmpD-associated family protein [Propionibacteriaceae bacterium]|jgi:uncharacterized protein YdeI (YjbR/CyaY-like superfamily)|nr:YdeI/OmpD-associated family protein [Propionibacteriaceae bacterium]
MTGQPKTELLFISRGDFRTWLSENAEASDGVWLVFGKTKTVATLTAHEALEEALCFGWIDGQMQSIDETKYIKYFAPRRARSPWSDKNKLLVGTLRQKGLMTELGERAVDTAQRNGSWDTQKPGAPTHEQMQQFVAMLEPFADAHASFQAMSPSVRKSYAGSYFFGAKTEEGKRKRFETIVERLNLNLNPVESMHKKS